MAGLLGPQSVTGFNKTALHFRLFIFLFLVHTHGASEMGALKDLTAA